MTAKIKKTGAAARGKHRPVKGYNPKHEVLRLVRSLVSGVGKARRNQENPSIGIITLANADKTNLVIQVFHPVGPPVHLSDLLAALRNLPDDEEGPFESGG